MVTVFSRHPLMFAPLYPEVSKRRTGLLSVSLILHFVFLAWLLHSPAPIFVAQSSVVKGQSGSMVTRIYFGGDSGVAQEKPQPQVRWQRAHKKNGVRVLTPPPPKLEMGNEIASARASGPAAGSPYGSLSYGTMSGPEIRPALPVVSPDPVFGSDAASVQGDVIVEITIDEAGNIVQKTVLQSLGPAIDGRVLAALEKWQFSPASKNGVPIPSKQDVYYHFPR